ncbi:MAG: zinc ribbon domain-containing protein [Synergistaceae bacterium]|nr:zinc ribbon domain-containing protein [Synergistaceae bacterium]
MKCANCGAPIEANDEVCQYCGTRTAYGISMLEEHKRHEQEEQHRRELENLPKIKYVSEAFVIFVYVITLGYYAPYWYATRMKPLNDLDSGTKLPAWAAGIYALVCAGIIFSSEIGDSLGLSPEMSQEIFNYAFGITFTGSILLAFWVRRILQGYAAKFMERNIAVGSVASSAIMTVFFGPVYLQHSINKMIKMKLLAPQI